MRTVCVGGDEVAWIGGEVMVASCFLLTTGDVTTFDEEDSTVESSVSYESGI